MTDADRMLLDFADQWWQRARQPTRRHPERARTHTGPLLAAPQRPPERSGSGSLPSHTGAQVAADQVCTGGWAAGASSLSMSAIFVNAARVTSVDVDT